MRLRGEATIGTRQSRLTADAAKTTLTRSWRYEQTAQFAGSLLQDYLAWVPEMGANPSVDIMHQALGAIGQSEGAFRWQHCCFAVAWKRPTDRDWSAWLHEMPVGDRGDVARALSMGLHNATVDEPDPARRLALAERIAVLHTQHGQEPVVREQLAKALVNATVVEPDPARRSGLIRRLERIVEEHSGERILVETVARAQALCG